MRVKSHAFFTLTRFSPAPFFSGLLRLRITVSINFRTAFCCIAVGLAVIWHFRKFSGKVDKHLVILSFYLAVVTKAQTQNPELFYF